MPDSQTGIIPAHHGRATEAKRSGHLRSQTVLRQSPETDARRESGMDQYETTGIQKPNRFPERNIESD